MRHWQLIIGFTLAFLALAWSLVAAIAVTGTALSGNWQLVFQNADISWRWWGLLGLTAACVAVIVILFRDERRLVPLPTGLMLLSLRTGLVLVVFLTLLEPMWTWSYDRSRTERVLLAIDVSESMDTVDQQATDLEKLRWADALGFFGGADVAARTRRWIAALEAGQEPEWISENEVSDPEQRQRLIQVRKENLQSQLKEVASLSRIELLRRACIVPSSSLIDELGKVARLQLSAFADNAAELNADQLQQPLETAKLQVDRMHSRLSEPVDAAHSGSTEAPLAGVILLSDGHDTGKNGATGVAQRLQGLGVPVHTVLVGSEHRPRDLSIMHVDHPETVFLKDQPQVKTILQTSGFEGETLNLYMQSIDAPDRPPLQKTLTPRGPTSEVEFTLPEETIGKHRYRIWTDVAARESREDNNTADFSFNVVDDRARVLLLDGEGRWEFRYLDDALSRDAQISLDRVLFEQPFLGVMKKPYFPSRIEELAPPSPLSTPFATYDLVLVGDVSPADMNAQHWQELDQYVRQEGGTLVLTAGKRFFPFSYRGTLAEQLLPIQNPRVLTADRAAEIGPPAQRGFRLAIAADGEPLPMFQLNADTLLSQKIWSELPGHLWGIVGEVRGGASVWAAGLPPGQKPTLDAERRNAIIAQHYVGAGQVIWIGVDSTWRWRYLVGDLYHHRFWGQLARWAVSFKAAASNDSIRLGLREAVIRTGHTAHVQVRLDERFHAKFPQVKLQAVLTRQGEGRPYSQTVDLTARDGNAVLLEAQVPGLPAGEFKVQLNVTGAESEQDLPEVLLIVNAELTPELQDVHANRALLEQIATVTGGQFLQLNELSRLPKLFQNSTQSEHVREEIPLYSHWVILALFCGIAMTEWVTRKINGLP